MPEYKECIKQYTTEKIYCLTSGEGEARCKELFEVGLKDCKAVHDRCAASLPLNRTK